ncbi:MAG: hypothetical protein H0Z39_10850 [Peptococcaceae bacterium]|nr:hypothetical protein [Peptococcaceae bacterium]
MPYDKYILTDTEIQFFHAGDKVAMISRLGDAELCKKRRPANLITECRACYGLSGGLEIFGPDGQD